MALERCRLWWHPGHGLIQCPVTPGRGKRGHVPVFWRTWLLPKLLRWEELFRAAAEKASRSSRNHSSLAPSRLLTSRCSSCACSQYPYNVLLIYPNPSAEVW